MKYLISVLLFGSFLVACTAGKEPFVRLPTSYQRIIGARTRASITATTPVHSNAVAVHIIASNIARFHEIAHLSFTPEVTLLDDATFSAYALPGGYYLIGRSFLLSLASFSEVRAVCALLTARLTTNTILEALQQEYGYNVIVRSFSSTNRANYKNHVTFVIRRMSKKTSVSNTYATLTLAMRFLGKSGEHPIVVASLLHTLETSAYASPPLFGADATSPLREYAISFANTYAKEYPSVLASLEEGIEEDRARLEVLRAALRD